MIPYYISTLGRWAIVDGDNAADALANAAADTDVQEILHNLPPRVVRPATDAEVCDWTSHWARMRRDIQEMRESRKAREVAWFARWREIRDIRVVAR